MSSISHTKTPSFLIIGVQWDGLGDVYGAHAICQRVQHLYPESLVVFSVTPPSQSGLDLLHDHGRVRQLSKELIEKLQITPYAQIAKRLADFAKIVIYPAYSDRFLPDALASRPSEDLIKIRECSAPLPSERAIVPPLYTLGLNRELQEKGVLLPLHCNPTHPAATSQERLQSLTALDPSVIHQILGAPFSAEAVEAFSERARLHCAYCADPHPLLVFIDAVAGLAPDKEMVICAPTQPLDGIANVAENMMFLHIKTLTVLSAGDSQSFDLSPFGSKCTLVFAPMSQKHCHILLKSSEPEAICTGDLSPFEMMAQYKTIVYEQRPHKHEAASAMLNIVEKQSRCLRALLAQGWFGDKTPQIHINLYQLAEGMKQLFTKLNEDPELLRHWHQCIDTLFAHHDFTPQLRQILKERLNPSYAEALDTLKGQIETTPLLSSQDKQICLNSLHERNLEKLLRQTAIKPHAISLLMYLVENAEHLQMDISAAGPTSGNALDIAKRYGNAEAIDFLQSNGLTPTTPS